MRTPLRPFKVRDLGTVPLGARVTARDGTSCLKYGNRTLFIFGDTVIDNNALVANNSMLVTTDDVFSDGISSSLSVSQNFQDSSNVPLQWIPKTTAEKTFEGSSSGKQVVLWPGQMFRVEATGKRYTTFSKFYYLGPWNFEGVGTGLAEVVGYDVPAKRTSINAGTPPDARGQLEPDIIVRSDGGMWDTALALSKDQAYLYMFETVQTTADSRFYVARAATANEGFKQPGNWQVWACTAQTGSNPPSCAAGTTHWSPFSDISATNIKASVVTSINRKGAVSLQASVDWNDYYHAYLLTYIESDYGTCYPGTQWCQSNRMMMRLAPDATGPWSSPVQIDAITDKDASGNPALPYVGKAHGCLAEEDGRTQYFGYSLMGEITGSGIRFKQLRFAGARGDFAGNTWGDIALTGGAGWSTIPIASSKGDGTFTVTNAQVSNFPAWAATAGVKKVSGDFDGDGIGDIALTGASNWSTIPVAFSNGNGTFTVTNQAPYYEWPGWAAQSGVQTVAGDFHGDGWDDIALVGGRNPDGSAWTTIPVAHSISLGYFTVTNMAVSDTNFGVWANCCGAKAVAGDFNGDGKGDIALTGGSGWGTIPVAFANTIEDFTVTNNGVGSFPFWATMRGAKPVAGDFNGDGKGDIALTGGYREDGVTPWGSIPVAFSLGNGSFYVTNASVANFPVWATLREAKPVAGDFNGDGKGDIALTGGFREDGVTPWGSIPVAFSNGDGTFNVTNANVTSFPTWATQSGATPVGAY